MSGNPRTGTISAATGQTFIGQGAGSRVGSLLIQFDFSAAANHSISIVGRIQADGTGINKPLTGIAYLNKTLGDVVSSAITADAIILVDAAGLDIFADVTTVTTGSVTYSCIPMVG